jgi:hypothetical protein
MQCGTEAGGRYEVVHAYKYKQKFCEVRVEGKK